MTSRAMMLFQSRPYWLKNWDMRTVSGATSAAGGQHDREEELVPCPEEGEHSCTDQSGDGERQDNVAKTLETIASVEEAASSIAIGMASKKPLRSHMAIGIAKAVSAMIK